jgi:hypothetical protein
MSNMHPVAKVVLGIGLVFAALYGLTYAWTQFTMDTAERRGEASKQEQVEANGAYRVAQHDWFYNMCGDIKAKQQNVELMEDSGYTKQEIAANKAQLNEMVNDYNSKAANNYTAGQFKADELPYQIDAEKEVTSCGSA